ncbi:MAG: hypothetical protein ACREM3_00495 [Candidatus Rokuibacteriota bacterium]
MPLALFLASERRIAGAIGFPLDDSWIHLHFARNLAEGAGFSYNPGIPVAGSTAPLWTILLGGAFAATGPSIALVKAFGVVLAAAAAVATVAAARAWGASGPLAAGAGVALLWTGPMAWGALSGMEVPLAALLVAVAVGIHARGPAWLAALVAALATLARPEAVVLVPLLALARAPRARRLVLFAVVTAIVLAPAVAFSLATVGAPVPATAAAKVEGGLVGWLGGVREPLGRLLLERPWQFLREWIAWLTATHWLLVALCAPAVAAVWIGRAGPALGVPALALVVHPLAMALLAPYRGPGFQEGRYSTHLLPLAFVVLAAAAPVRRPWPQAVVVAAWLAVAAATLPAAADRYAWGVQNINAMQVHLGHWVDEHLPKRARLALNDIGAIAYVSRRQVIDLMGLVTPEIIPYRREGEAGVIRYVAETCPDYLIVFPAWFPELTARRWLVEPVYRVRLERNEVAGGPEMIVYRLTRCTV